MADKLNVKYLDVTDADGNVAFGTTTYKIKLLNSGTNSCFINLNTAATTSHWELNPNDEIVLGLNEITAIHAICASTLTTTLKIIGIEQW